MELPNEAERERLILLNEELHEAGQAICKILRHGYESYHPDNTAESNRYLLMKELGHAQHALQMMMDAGDVYRTMIDRYEDLKARTIHQWLHFQPPEES